MTTQTRLRASDADRQSVADQLSEHFAAGRLDQAEFTIRMDSAYEAVFVDQLPELMADLPAVQDAVVPPANPSTPQWHQRAHDLQAHRFGGYHRVGGRGPSRPALGVAFVVAVVALALLAGGPWLWALFGLFWFVGCGSRTHGR